MRNYRDLKVWAKAHSLTLEIYRLSRTFPREEMFGVTSQTRRCCASIGANLAEGCGRQTNREFGRFVRIAMGSASELDYHLILSRDLGLLKSEDYQRVARDLTEIRKMLGSLLNKIEIEIGDREKTKG